jgi:hypothetical protein
MYKKKILVAGIAGGLLLMVVILAAGAAAAAILPFNIYDIPGMRPATDPVSLYIFSTPLSLLWQGQYYMQRYPRPFPEVLP